MQKNSEQFIDFIIIGAQRCGTTSLYNYIAEHPKVATASQKEIHFFDYNYQKGHEWYKSQFINVDHKIRDGLLTGEASPYYIFHPHAPKRIFKDLPKIKLITLLRNPVDRAYSHYNHNLKMTNNIEKLSFEDALKMEASRLDGELEKMENDDTYYSLNHQHFSYLSRGIYYDQLLRWFEYFDQEKILILKSEDLYSNVKSVMKQVFEFLSLPNIELSSDKVHNSGKYDSMKSSTREFLIDYFKPHNKKLYKLLNRNFEWDY